MVRGTARMHVQHTYSCSTINLSFGLSYHLTNFGHWVFLHSVYINVCVSLFIEQTVNIRHCFYMPRYLWIISSLYFTWTTLTVLSFLTLQQNLTCGSIMSGQRSELDRMVAFSVDILSLGRPSLFQIAIWASSVSRDRGSSPSVIGTGGWNNYVSKMAFVSFLNLWQQVQGKDRVILLLN